MNETDHLKMSGFESQILAARMSRDSRTTGVSEIVGVIRSLKLFLMTKFSLIILLTLGS